MTVSSAMVLFICFAVAASCMAATASAKAAERTLLQGGFVANIVCDATGSCDDGRGGRYYDENRDDRRRNNDYNNGYNSNGYNNGYNNNGYNNGYGRKLKQNVVANIVCDALGNCDDGRGRRYYDEGRDSRRNNGGYDNNRGNNGGYDNDRGNNYGNGNYGK